MIDEEDQHRRHGGSRTEFYVNTPLGLITPNHGEIGTHSLR
jgi:hypothetical protein